MKTKMLAVLAVLAMAFAGVAVFTVTEQNDADPAAGDSAPTSAASASNGMKVIAYKDGVILIDTNGMTTLTDGSNLIVKLSATISNTPVEYSIGPISATNGRLYVDGSGSFDGTNKLLRNGEVTIISLYEYGNNTVKDTAELTYSGTAPTVELHVNHDATWAKVNGATSMSEDSYETTPRTLDRNLKYDMDEKFNSLNGYAYGWSLVEWGDNAVPGSVTHSVEPKEKYAVEDLIIAMYDAGIESPISNGKITLYAIWEASVLNFYVADSDTSITSGTTKLSDLITDGLDTKGEIKVTTKIAEGQVTAIAQKGDFAIIRIQQTAGSVTSYSYNLSGIFYVDQAGVLQNATKGTDYNIELINNGLYKLTDMTKSLVIKITATASGTAIPVTAYSFGISDINNTNAASTGGQARLSLDLYDAVSTATDTIKIKGTYFKNIDNASVEQRVYGNLENLTFSGTNLKGWIDKAPETLTDEELSAKQMTLTADGNVFDLEVDLGAGVSFYAAQGVWDNGTSDNITTPWALYKA